MSAADAIQPFLDAINRGDPAEIALFLTEDHHFVDSLGIEVHGRERMQEAWEGYFQLVLDYSIEIEESFEDGNTIVLIGTASGTYAPDGQRYTRNVWSVPAAWRAVLRDEKVAYWQVFADNEPIRRIMRGEV
jgi:ketosteroid isomerase-like protein